MRERLAYLDDGKTGMASRKPGLRSPGSTDGDGRKPRGGMVHAFERDLFAASLWLTM